MNTTHHAPNTRPGFHICGHNHLGAVSLLRARKSALAIARAMYLRFSTLLALPKTGNTAVCTDDSWQPGGFSLSFLLRQISVSFGVHINVHSSHGIRQKLFLTDFF